MGLSYGIGFSVFAAAAFCVSLYEASAALIPEDSDDAKLVALNALESLFFASISQASLSQSVCQSP